MTNTRDRWTDHWNGLARFWLARLRAMPVAMVTRFPNSLARRTAEHATDQPRA
ncbi:hypothetical protein SMC26_05920 [Actinomadura fulvescens]|uniref:Uncharacterized protein n=1 Tax=Actinomadura fulvescens TaxID=46160 RepID=A0ABP6CEL5_9ACTN